MSISIWASVKLLAVLAGVLTQRGVKERGEEAASELLERRSGARGTSRKPCVSPPETHLLQQNAGLNTKPVRNLNLGDMISLGILGVRGLWAKTQLSPLLGSRGFRTQVTLGQWVSWRRSWQNAG